MSLYKGNTLISGHQVLYSTTGQNTDGAMTQKAVTDNFANTNLTNLGSTSSTNFDGQWVMTYLQLAQNVSIASGGTNSYSLADYLPNDNHYYEVILDVMAITGTTVGSTADITVGNSVYSGIPPRICSVVTRVSGQSFLSSGQCILIVPPNDRRVVVAQAASHTATLYLVRVHGYRRIGTNS